MAITLYGFQNTNTYSQDSKFPAFADATNQPKPQEDSRPKPNNIPQKVITMIYLRIYLNLNHFLLLCIPIFQGIHWNRLVTLKMKIDASNSFKSLLIFPWFSLELHLNIYQINKWWKIEYLITRATKNMLSKRHFKHLKYHLKIKVTYINMFIFSHLTKKLSFFWYQRKINTLNQLQMHIIKAL